LTSAICLKANFKDYYLMRKRWGELLEDFEPPSPKTEEAMLRDEI
jgi:hypothetical protein